VFYCGASHQKQDWKTHKLVCATNDTNADATPSVPNVYCTDGESSSRPAPSDSSRNCRCMFCGDLLLLDSEDAAVAHMEVCPALQEQLNGPGQYTIPKAFQHVVNKDSLPK
jgi:hypothetical protein